MNDDPPDIVKGIIIGLFLGLFLGFMGGCWSNNITWKREAIKQGYAEWYLSGDTARWRWIERLED